MPGCFCLWRGRLHAEFLHAKATPLHFTAHVAACVRNVGSKGRGAVEYAANVAWGAVEFAANVGRGAVEFAANGGRGALEFGADAGWGALEFRG